MLEGDGLFPFSCIFGFAGQNPDDGHDSDLAGGDGGQDRVMAEKEVEAKDMAEAEEQGLESIASADGCCCGGSRIYSAHVRGKKL